MWCNLGNLGILATNQRAQPTTSAMWGGDTLVTRVPKVTAGKNCAQINHWHHQYDGTPLGAGVIYPFIWHWRLLIISHLLPAHPLHAHLTGLFSGGSGRIWLLSPQVLQIGEGFTQPLLPPEIRPVSNGKRTQGKAHRLQPLTEVEFSPGAIEPRIAKSQAHAVSHAGCISVPSFSYFSPGTIVVKTRAFLC